MPMLFEEKEKSNLPKKVNQMDIWTDDFHH
jgi:hypothetical protein